MIAYIFTGGTVNLKAINVEPEENDIIIAADSGYKNAELLGDRVEWQSFEEIMNLVLANKSEYPKPHFD